MKFGFSVPMKVISVGSKREIVKFISGITIGYITGDQLCTLTVLPVTLPH